jgi:hypothetical protein
VFNLSGNVTATTAGTIVSINGVQQIPTTAYAVSSNVLTFTEAPAVGDLIDVRVLTTTTTVTGISNSTGNAFIGVSDNAGNINATGNLVLTGGTYVGDGSGLTNLNVSGNSISFGSSNVAVRTNNGNVDTAVNGTVVQSVSPGLVTVNGDLAVGGNINFTGNVTSDAISSGTTSITIPNANGDININVNGNRVAAFIGTGLYVTGGISATGDVIAQNVNSLSDATLKTNVAPIENAGQVVDALTGVSYDWVDGSGHAYGLIAQDVEQVVPEAVKTGDDGIKSVNYSMLIPFLIETVKKLSEEVAELKTQIQK